VWEHFFDAGGADFPCSGIFRANRRCFIDALRTGMLPSTTGNGGKIPRKGSSMTKECIFSSNASPAMGPYSQAVRAGNLLFVSGQGPFAKDGSGAVAGTIEEETKRTLDNLKAVLDDAGSGLEHVIKTTCFLGDMNNFKAFNAVYGTYFTQNPPARTTVEAARLPLDIKIEVEAIAIIPGG